MIDHFMWKNLFFRIHFCQVENPFLIETLDPLEGFQYKKFGNYFSLSRLNGGEFPELLAS